MRETNQSKAGTRSLAGLLGRPLPPDVLTCLPAWKMGNGLGYSVAMTRTSPPPFFADAARGVRLYCGDALELLRDVRDGCFDVVFADPPYFLSNDGVSNDGVTCVGGTSYDLDSKEESR